MSKFGGKFPNFCEISLHFTIYEILLFGIVVILLWYDALYGMHCMYGMLCMCGALLLCTVVSVSLCLENIIIEIFDYVSFFFCFT